MKNEKVIFPDVIEMAEELEKIFGRKVDFLTRKSVENSANCTAGKTF